MLKLVTVICVGLALNALVVQLFGAYFDYWSIRIRMMIVPVPLPSVPETDARVVWGSIAYSVLWTSFSTFPGLLIATLLMARRSRNESETRCRKCRYVLRGLQAPRCPECGEAI